MHDVYMAHGASGGTLNPSQQAVVDAPCGYHLVLAGAGTGKTQTVVHRVARLAGIWNHPAPAAGILLLSFTRASAQEMLDRAERLVGPTVRERVVGGTIHGWSAKFLRRYASCAALSPTFGILDEDDMLSVWSDVLADAGYKATKSPIPRAHGCLQLWSTHRNTGVQLDLLVARMYPKFVDVIPEIARVCADYTAKKAKMGALDFDDLLLQSQALLAARDDVRRDVSSRYPHIIVDEFQDVNAAQASIADMLAEVHGDLCVVGDDAQSIYAFRGADVSHIRTFPKRHPGCQVSLLTTNYRSHNGILGVANACMNAMPTAFRKSLQSHLATDGTPPLVRIGGDEQMHSDLVVRDIVAAIRAGADPTSQCILVRSGKHSLMAEMGLTKHGIAFIKRGGLSFAEYGHIKDVIALLRTVARPDDAMAWTRVFKLQPGVGTVTASKLTALAATGKPWLQASGKRRGDLEGLHDAIQQMRSSPIRDVPHIAIRAYMPWMEDAYDDAHARRDDLSIIHDLIDGHTDLGEALDAFTLDRPEKNRDPGKPCVTVSTIHSAKGLEWDSVHLMSCVTGKFPNAFVDPTDAIAMDEERRLFYVAVTRARTNLTIGCPGMIKSYAGDPLDAPPSRFVHEVQDACRVERVAAPRMMNDF